MKVVLVAPQIPQNTGNIVRTCAAVGAQLVLVRPLGFSISDRHLKRAGLDYWCHVPVEIWDDLTPLSDEPDPWFFSSFGHRPHASASFQSASTLVFGSEDAGLPAELLERHPERVLRIPMVPDRRCLNLSVSVGIGLYTAWQQMHFQGALQVFPSSPCQVNS
jgi:tRNA (cytidine/uridine-2'-O-)-methyltransferase